MIFTPSPRACVALRLLSMEADECTALGYSPFSGQPNKGASRGAFVVFANNRRITFGPNDLADCNSGDKVFARAVEHDDGDVGLAHCDLPRKITFIVWSQFAIDANDKAIATIIAWYECRRCRQRARWRL